MGYSPEETENDKNDPDNKKLEHEGWNSLQEKERSCTDCICLLLLIAVWFAMTVVGFIVCGVFENDNLQEGNPARLINPMDYKGAICGFSDSVKDRPYGYYFPDQTVVCVKKCPNEDDFSAFICRTDDMTVTANGNTNYGYTKVNSNECFFQMDTQVVLNRCIIQGAFDAAYASASAQASSNSVTLTAIASYPDSPYEGQNSGFVSQFLGDMYQYSGYIFGFGIGVATVVAFAYLWFLRIPGLLTIIIWGIILSVAVLLIAGAFMLWSLSKDWRDDGKHTDAEADTMLYLSYIMFVIAALYVCLTFVLGKRVNLAIAIVKEAARALGSMPSIIFMPIYQILGLVIFLIPWFIYMLYLASSGEVREDPITGYRTFEYDTNTKYAFLYMLFCWFWTSEFLIACGQLIIALAISAWYFCRDKSKIGNVTVIWATKTLIFYHLGTAAFGSLIIAIILTIRAIISYIQRKAKKSGNKILEYVMCCLQCCMWCLEKCMRFLNKNAYIQTAIYGYSFCKAARKAFFLLLRNILRVAAVSIVGDFVLLLGKLFVPVATTFLLYLILAYSVPSGEMNGLVSPLIFTFILAYFVAFMFSEIFGMCIETILCCYIADEEMFAPEKRFADGGLKSAIQKTAQGGATVQVVPEAEPAPAEKKDEGLM